ncbi:Polysulfide reductase chain A [bacterium HR29]|nr:Polysulfide reductase chain A [bacterium HR29]
MGTITRRTFLKGTGVAAGTLAAEELLFGRGRTLLPATKGEAAAAEPAESWAYSACWIGKQDCGIAARKFGDRVVKLEGLVSHPRNVGTLCPKGVAQISALYDPHRVRRPLIRTNEKGVPGEFREATWDEAIALVAERIKAARAKDPKLVVWQKGRSKSGPLYDTAFTAALGTEKLHHGAFCSDAGYRACEYTVGLNGVLNPDYRFCKLAIHWGYNLTGGGGNKLCWITFPRQFVQARERGMRVISIDPRRQAFGPHTDVWLPIRPGTDLALALALVREIIALGKLDTEYLLNYTNAPFLVGEDGFFLREGGKELVWDTKTNTAKPYDAEGLEPALEGSFRVGGRAAKTAFELLKEHTAGYTAEWAAEITGLEAEAIRDLAREIVQTAGIGSTIVVDGVEVAYRPVGIHTYHAAQTELGFQAVRTMLLAMMLVGAVGAAGGQLIDATWKVHANFEKFGTFKLADPPYNIWLSNSKWFPINSNSTAVVSLVLQDPAKWGVEKLPEVLIVHMANPVLAFGSQKDIVEGLKRIPFVVVIDPWLSKTADLLADVVLPASTLEKYEGPLSAGDIYTDAVALRMPLMSPLGESRSELEIYLDICEATGTLYGENGYIDQINKALGLKDEFALPLDKKPTPREVFDRWAKAQGLKEGIAYFEQNGVWVKGPVSPKKLYGWATEPRFGGIRHRLYGESLLAAQQQMKAKGAEEWAWRDYTPFPTWRTPTMEQSPKEYDLYLISYKLIEFKQARTHQLPLVAELGPEQRLWMNPKAAKARGLKEGDEVWVEAHNAVTGETKRVRTKLALTEGIRPDTVGLPHHFGGEAKHPWAENDGPGAASLFFTGPGYIQMTADQSFHVKVRVYRAEEA